MLSSNVRYLTVSQPTRLNLIEVNGSQLDCRHSSSRRTSAGIKRGRRKADILSRRRRVEVGLAERSQLDSIFDLQITLPLSSLYFQKVLAVELVAGVRPPGVELLIIPTDSRICRGGQPCLNAKRVGVHTDNLIITRKVISYRKL